MRLDPKLRKLLYREDFIAFVRFVMSVVSPATYLHNWHIDAIAHQLELVTSGKSTRLLVTLPPRYLKTIVISIAYVAWRLGHDPKLRVVGISYSNDFSYNISRSCRKVMEHPSFRSAFPECRLTRTTESELETSEGGGHFATSVAGQFTGRGGDLFICDDPIKAEDAFSANAREKVRSFYTSTLVTRPNNKLTAAIIVVMQRLHSEDLAGFLIENGNYNHLNLSAIARDDESIATGTEEFYFRHAGEALQPARETIKMLEDQRSIMGSIKFSAQYLQEPVPIGGLMVQDAWIKRTIGPTVRQPGDTVVQSWDTAITDGLRSDYSACLTAIVRNGRVHIIDAIRERLIFPDLQRRVIENARKYDATTVLIEDAASGKQLLQVFGRDGSCRPLPIGVRPDGDKTERLASASSQIEAGVLYVPDEAPWLAAFLNEVLGFPGGPHDDQVDALSQLLNWHGAHPRILCPVPYYGQKAYGMDGFLDDDEFDGDDD